MRSWRVKEVGDLGIGEPEGATSARLTGSHRPGSRRGLRLRAPLQVAAASLLLLGVGPGVEPRVPTAPLLLSGAWLIDGTGAPPVANAWVRIEGDRITGVGEGPPPEEPAAEIVDLRGRTVLPGLSDMHFHLLSREELPWQLKFALAHGVTVVRDVGIGTAYIEMPADEARWRCEELARIPPARRALLTAEHHWELLRWVRGWLEEQDAAPHLFSAGVMLYGWPPIKRFLSAGDQTRAVIDGNLAVGVDFIKVHQWTSSEALSQAVALAEENGLHVVGHVPTGMSSVGAIDVGLRTLEHVRLRPWEVLDDSALIGRYPLDLTWPRRDSFWARFDPDGEAVIRTLEAWEERKDRFFLDPTLVEWEWETCDYPDPNDPVLDLLPADRRERLTECSLSMTPETLAEVRATLSGVSRFVGLAHRRGIRILTGTDVWDLPGVSLHRELELLVQAGLSPVEVVHASTGRAAEELGVADRGTIEPGKLADLVIVRGNLAEDIRAIQAIETIVLGGRRYDRNRLLREASELAKETSSEP